ncbi:MAG: glycosyltransferase family 9 protein [Burkholderiaceae bacterium]
MTLVLVRLPNHIGDACMALPALRLLAASGCTPALVGQPWAGELFAGEGWRFDPIEGRLLQDFARVRALAANLGPSPRGVLLPNSFGSALLFRAAGVRSAGLATDGRSVLLESTIAEPEPMHEVERFWRVACGALAAWNIAPAIAAVPAELGLKLAARHVAAARRLIAEHQLPSRFALLAPIATGLHHGRAKHWPEFAALVPALRERGIEPVAMPPANELEASRAALPGARILPPASLGTYAALAARSTLVIANDSGVSHVAAAVGARQVTIFGVTAAGRTGPWNPRAVGVGRADAWPAPNEVIAALDQALAIPA